MCKAAFAVSVKRKNTGDVTNRHRERDRPQLSEAADGSEWLILYAACWFLSTEESDGGSPSLVPVGAAQQQGDK